MPSGPRDLSVLVVQIFLTLRAVLPAPVVTPSDTAFWSSGTAACWCSGRAPRWERTGAVLRGFTGQTTALTSPSASNESVLADEAAGLRWELALALSGSIDLSCEFPGPIRVPSKTSNPRTQELASYNI